MTRSELIALVPNKPYRMPCCRECTGKSKKDCDENPLNCFDFYLLNKETIDKLSQKALKDGADNARYIDVDEVKLNIQRNLMPNVDYDGTVTVENAERYFLNLLDNTPTADVVEVKQGEWKPTKIPAHFGGVIYECSICGAKDGDHTKILGRYCRKCGAKMNGERKCDK